MRREKLDLARRREELGAQLREKTFEADQLTMLKTAHESEIEWLREQVRTSQEEIDALSATAKQVEGALAESAELKSLLGETMGMNGSEKEKREALDAESRAQDDDDEQGREARDVQADRHAQADENAPPTLEPEEGVIADDSDDGDDR